MGRLIDADAFRNKLVKMTNDPFASTNRPLNWSHAYESVMVELDRMPNAQGWISVKERTPETISNKVLVWVEGGFRPFMGHFEEGDNLFPDQWFNLEAEGECFTSPVTHWMELPEGPKEE